MPKDKLNHSYLDHRSRAKSNGIGFELTFDEWLGIWTKSGKLALRGRGIGKYCMSRNGDKGPYKIGNVTIKLFEENNREQKANGSFRIISGSDHYKSKINEKIAVKIFKDKRPQKVIAEQYGITQSNVSKIKARVSWAEVTKHLKG